ncbi:DUF262 domain-containing protein [Anaerofustis sp. NSJ-163]|uniref:DUF262 domain-containing protein n=1 Tax=Anaerofustis sp. NSJ-163 TaxID=2944391 RepID=UPI00209C5AC2|nr:DUF262 domain-containing protein [Anaerofustis sp. NSJ-163]MCO8193064.1 DUF262 domain-containing protein [Anaerofustis sp. NSJ-163]
MSKLNIDQQTVRELFENKKSDFLIPDYQRPYAWSEEECGTLWDDIFLFAFPNENCDDFDENNDEYFLGPIVTFKNNSDKLEIIDGQQRLTTLMILLRAFYSRFENIKDNRTKKILEDIAKCIWKTDEFGTPNKNKLKINSEVATDDDKEEFLHILKEGSVNNSHKSKYATVFRFFQNKIDIFVKEYPTYTPYLPVRILNNCILLPIEAESQDTALRIFSTLNDRGKPLSDTDIFKAQLYKFYSLRDEKEVFIDRWKKLEEICDDIFRVSSGSPMDELFTRYMYYERAKQGNKNTTTEALRKFYEKDKYALLKKEETLNNLESLANFWNDVENQNENVFSQRILKKLFVLHYAPNSMWTYLVSVYFLHYKDKDCMLNEDNFYLFLDKITAYILGYAFVNPGVNALRTPAYPEMIKIVNNLPVDFSKNKIEKNRLRKIIEDYSFTNVKPITKSILAWWMYYKKEQDLINLETRFEIEHIYAKKRQEVESSSIDKKKLDAIGNKAFLEKYVNIRAADYRFSDKKRYYRGFTSNNGKEKKGTQNKELLDLADITLDFNENNIDDRTNVIITNFIKYLDENNLFE